MPPILLPALMPSGIAGTARRPLPRRSDGHVAEWLRNGLQNRVLRFNSGRGLQVFNYLAEVAESHFHTSVDRQYNIGFSSGNSFSQRAQECTRDFPAGGTLAGPRVGYQLMRTMKNHFSPA